MKQPICDNFPPYTAGSLTVRFISSPVFLSLATFALDHFTCAKRLDSAPKRKKKKGNCSWMSRLLKIETNPFGAGTYSINEFTAVAKDVSFNKFQ